MTTPTQRTLAFLKKEGQVMDTVERWIPNPKHPGGGFRKDFLGIIDILVLTPTGIMGIQSTGSDFAGHWQKLTKEKASSTRAWLSVPGTTLMLIGWRKVKETRGGARMVWKPRIKYITLKDLPYEDHPRTGQPEQSSTQLP